MKELIENINKKITNYKKTKEQRNESTLGDLYLLAHLEILKDLEKIQQQEEKPFDPLVLGFIEVPMMYPEDVATYQKYYELKLLKHSNRWLIYKFNGIINDEFYLTRMIKIPNHRFGVELLQNLGVIDAY